MGERIGIGKFTINRTINVNVSRNQFIFSIRLQRAKTDRRPVEISVSFASRLCGFKGLGRHAGCRRGSRKAFAEGRPKTKNDRQLQVFGTLPFGKRRFVIEMEEAGGFCH